MMLVTDESNRRNRNLALGCAGGMALGYVCAAYFSPIALLFLAFCPLVYWLIRRRCLRRLRVAQRPFPDSWERILEDRVAYYRALPATEKLRFRQLVALFLDEVRITGIRTGIDDTVRILVAASAVIPTFGFRDWEYRRLGEVLIYPDAFGDKYQTKDGSDGDRNILGMIGLAHLRGVMILSKPSLLAGFDSPSGQDNVGVHEFVHLVEQEEISHGLPAEVPWSAVKHWLDYVARELSHDSKKRSAVNSYAYTNEHEFLAVLSEYFFKSPDAMRDNDPELYALMREMFHQNPQSPLPGRGSTRRRHGRNSPCPCGSGQKYKNCCGAKDAQIGPKSIRSAS